MAKSRLVQLTNNLYYRAPKGGMKARHEEALSAFMSSGAGGKKLFGGPKCPIVFFDRKKAGGAMLPFPEVAQRCTGRVLADANKFRCQSNASGRFVNVKGTSCPAGSHRAKRVDCVDPTTGEVRRPNKKGKCPCMGGKHRCKPVERMLRK